MDDNKDLAVINDKINYLVKEIQTVKKEDRLNDSLFAPHNAPHYQNLATELSKTALVPKSYQGKPMELFLAMAMGYKIGLSVEQAIQDIAVINGRPTVYGDALLAIVKSQPDFVDMTEVPIMNGNVVEGYVCTIKRKGQTPVKGEFTLQDAKKAGLLNKPGPWTQYRERMLKMRARAFAARDSFPDSLKGIHCREEVEDYIEGELVEQPKTGVKSKTQQIKQELTYKQGQSNDEMVEKNDSGNEDKPNTEKAKTGTVRDRVAETRESETSSVDEVAEDGLITIPLINEIKSLIKEKNVDKERIDKALKHYQSDSIEDMRIKQAQDFIEKLARIEK